MATSQVNADRWRTYGSAETGNLYWCSACDGGGPRAEYSGRRMGDAAALAAVRAHAATCDACPGCRGVGRARYGHEDAPLDVCIACGGTGRAEKRA